MKIESQNRLPDDQLNTAGTGSNDSVYQLDAKSVAGEQDVSKLRDASKAECVTAGIAISIVFTC